MAFCNISLAEKSDDELLRDCLRKNEMSGSISVSFETEPSFFNALSVQGGESQVIIGKTENGEIIGFGVRSIKQAYVNGEIVDIGYLSGLRVNPEFRNNSFLARGYKFFRELDQDRRVHFYLTTIIEDNETARRVLESGRAGLPNYIPIDAISTFFIKPRARKVIPKHEIVKGNDIPLEEIVDFMNEHGSNKQFYPYYGTSDFNSSRLRDLRQDDFYVAVKRNEILGVVVKWDQESFKQTRVTGYDWKMQIAKPLINLASGFSNIPKLPRKGNLLHYFYAAFPTIKDNNPQVLESLLNEVASDSENQGYDYFTIGLTQSDPLSRAVKPFNPREYRSVVYLVSFDKTKEDLRYLNGKIPYLELGTL